MPESISHKRAKSKAAGKSGTTERPIPFNRFVDAVTKKTVTEIERSGLPKNLEKAARRLKAVHKPRKVLQVPQNDMGKAISAMKKIGVRGTVKNMNGSKRRSLG